MRSAPIPLDDVKLRQAIKDAIRHEKEAMDFYLLAAEKSVNPIPKLTFEMLASDEREHAWSFYRVYRWPDIEPFSELIAAPADSQSPWSLRLPDLQMAGFDEAGALSLAIKMESDSEQKLRQLADQIEDPMIKDIYLTNANMTAQHLGQLKHDYQTIAGNS